MQPNFKDSTGSGERHIPKVSIGMPVYNGELFIRKALDSLVAQTFTDFELVISDNASTDVTGQICQEYANKDHRIKYIRQPVNMGPMANFQFVLDKARAEYFMWAAADDMWAPECLIKWVEVLDADETVSLVFANYNVFSHLSSNSKRYYANSSVSSSLENRLLILMMNPLSNLIYGMFRKNSVLNLKIKAVDYFDVYFGYYMSTKGKIVICSDFLFFAGTKTEIREGYSIMGKKVRLLPFFLETKRLIDKIKSWNHRWFLYLVLLRQCVLMYKHTGGIGSYSDPTYLGKSKM